MLKLSPLLAAAALFVGACSTTQPLSPKRLEVDRPAIGDAASAELGSIVLQRTRSSDFDGIQIETEVTWLDLFRLRQFIIAPGRLVAKEVDGEFIYYFSDRLTYRDPISGTVSAGTGGICISKSDPSKMSVFVATGSCGIVPDKWPKLTRISIADESASNYHQELIYAGKTGSILRFLYRETKGGNDYPSLSLDFHVDLADGAVFGFKGARIEVVDATNTALIYRVVESFSEVQP